MKRVMPSMKIGNHRRALFLALTAALISSSGALTATALGADMAGAASGSSDSAGADAVGAVPAGAGLAGAAPPGTNATAGLESAGATGSSTGEGVRSPSPEIKATAADEAKRTEALISEASEAYQAGEYARAAALYQLLLERGVRNGHLYYDLGNAYQRLDNIGTAILNYRRAQLYLPRDGDVEANLAFARARARDRIEPGEESWARRVFFWYDSVSDFELFWATAVLNLAFWGLLMARGTRQRVGLRWALLVSGLGVVLSGGSAMARAWQHTQTPDAVVMGEEVSVRSGTDVNSVRLFVLHAGAEVSTRGQSGDWVRIQLPDGKRGWVERSFIGLIDP